MRYFFHLEDGECVRDPKGVDFTDDAAAMVEAAAVAQGLAQELSKHPELADEWRVVVKDAKGVRIGSVPVVQSEADPEPVSPVH
jgi:hypothetical protein